MTTTDTRPTSVEPTPKVNPSAGPDSLSSHATIDAHNGAAAEGQDSPQAIGPSASKTAPPAGTKTAPSARHPTKTTVLSLKGRKTSQRQILSDTQSTIALADDFPGQRPGDSHATTAGDSAGQPAAIGVATSRPVSLLADPLLALAADVLSDLEKVRIANENRFRQLTRDEEDKDGETRGFGLDEAHPDVARLGALVGMLTQAEHQATLNLGRLMRQHPLGPWMAEQKGIGAKQGARLLAAIGDPYVRPEIVREDGTTEPSRPRTVSELWALCGYHVIRTPVSGQETVDTQAHFIADGSGFPACQDTNGTHPERADGEQDGHPGQRVVGNHANYAGVAPKRARGAKANWSATAKMRAFLVAESCMKQPAGSRYRDVYDTIRAKYSSAVHDTECTRCGPKGKPAQPGTPLSDGHKHARALRAVAKEVLKDLWREAKRLHENT